jgi:hypothetical protein
MSHEVQDYGRIGKEWTDFLLVEAFPLKLQNELLQQTFYHLVVGEG